MEAALDYLRGDLPEPEKQKIEKKLREDAEFRKTYELLKGAQQGWQEQHFSDELKRFHRENSSLLYPQEIKAGKQVQFEAQKSAAHPGPAYSSRDAAEMEPVSSSQSGTFFKVAAAVAVIFVVGAVFWFGLRESGTGQPVANTLAFDELDNISLSAYLQDEQPDILQEYPGLLDTANLVMQWYQEGAYEKVAPVMESYAQRLPPSSPAYLLLGQSQLEAGEKEAALSAFQQASDQLQGAQKEQAQVKAAALHSLLGQEAAARKILTVLEKSADNDIREKARRLIDELD